MTAAYANPDDLRLKKFLVYSIVLHLSLAIAIAVSGYIRLRGEAWGGPGSPQQGTKVNLVSNAAIPMPKEPVVSPESKAVDPTKSLYKEEEKPKPPEPPKEVEKIPDFKKEKPLPPSHKSKVDPIKTPPPDNAIRRGLGGPPDLPTGTAPTRGDESSGLLIRGQGESDFATRYGWYVEALRNRVYGNWQQWTIDVAARNSRTIRCVMTFVIDRDGSIKDIRVTQSSGNSSYDNSAYRAVLNSNPAAKLPGDYSGSYVTVTLDFNPPGIQ